MVVRICFASDLLQDPDYFNKRKGPLVANAPVADQLQLLDVQGLDTKLAQLAHQRKNTPGLARVAEVKSQIADLSGALTASRTAASDLTRELTKAEQDVEQVVTRTARNQERLDSGAVSPRDAQALLAEIESLNNRQGILEEIQLGFMERLEAHKDTLDKLEAANSGMEDALKAAEAELAQELAVIDAEGKRVLAERNVMVSTLDEGLVKLYERIRSSQGGVGAAALYGNKCQGCRLEINPIELEQIRDSAADKIVRCEECSRILVRVPEAKSPLADA